MKQNDIRRVLKENAPLLTPHLSTSDNIINYIHSKRRTTFKKRRTLLIVVVLMLLSMVVAGAMGVPILEKLVVWKNDGVEWYIDTDLPVNVSSRRYTDAHRETWGDEFIDALERHGVNILLPTWKPDGYEPYDYYEYDEPRIYISIGFMNEHGHLLQLDARKFNEEEGVKSGDMFYINIDEDSEPLVFEIDEREIWWGKDTNMHGKEDHPDGSYDQIFWVDLNAYASFSGWLTDEEAERMIQSME